jgi:lipid II:glycine glycyltransferase (peptidoglycan interpeptide bridge formation enzyme)
MLSWQEWFGEAQDWDNLVLQHEDYTVYQSYAWGIHKSNLGWQVRRFIYKADEKTTHAVSQTLVKYFHFGIAVIWIPGGFLGESACYGPEFHQFLKKALERNLLYIRVNSLSSLDFPKLESFRRLGWRKCQKSLTTGLSLIYKPSDSEDDRASRASGNWRHNWKRSLKKSGPAYQWTDVSVEEMTKAYRVMELNKKLSIQMHDSEIISILKTFGSNCILVRCDDETGSLLAFRGALLMGNKGWDFFAVATPEGRKVYASHAAFMELMNVCGARGVSRYDMSGIDPVNNKGVYDFKKGTGAEEIRYLGEWEISNSKIFLVIASKLVSRKIR